MRARACALTIRSRLILVADLTLQADTLRGEGGNDIFICGDGGKCFRSRSRCGHAILVHK